MFPGPLRTFSETVRAGSIRRASEALNIAPSSVSRQIATLEREMGTALFERRAGGVALTHAGELVAAYARSVLVDYDSLRTDLDDLRGVRRRLLRVAMVEGAASYGPIQAITRFRAQFEAVSFDLRVMPAPQVIEAVLADQCDLGISFSSEPHHDIEKLASVAEPVVVAVRTDDPCSTEREIDLQALATMPLALPQTDLGIRRMLDRDSAAVGVKLAPVLASNAFETLREFVRCGAGAAVLPLLAVTRDVRAGVMRVAPLAGDAFRDTAIELIVLRTRRPPAILRAFTRLLIEEISSKP